MVEIKKVIDKDKTYVDKKGKEHASVNYYLVIGNTWVAIRPCFSQGYIQLDVVAERIINGKQDEHKE